MSNQNRRYVLKSRPDSNITEDTFERFDTDTPVITDGQVLVKTLWLSVDPAMRMWLEDKPSYVPPVGVGDVMRAGGVGRVVESRNERFPVGTLVQGMFGWQEYLVTDGRGYLALPDDPRIPTSYYLGVLGMTGLTAWAGLREIGKPQAGETVVVSAAAGAVGSVAAQMAKIAGARVVGIAGGPEKCALLTDTLGFDAAVDYRADDWRDQLATATPDGIDVDFENVGGEIMEGVFDRMNVHGRVILCGMVSQYNKAASGPANFERLLTQRIHLQGIIVIDHMSRAKEAAEELGGWVADGKMQALETVVEGFEQLPDALASLFCGANTGKLVVKIAND